MSPSIAINHYAALIWFIFWVYWAYSVFYEKATGKSKNVDKHEPIALVAASRITLWVSVFLVLVEFPQQTYTFNVAFLPEFRYLQYIGLGIALAGILFAIWARKTLGGNWNADPALKKGQTLTTTGPYALVRHPIYTGITLGIMGSAIAENSITGLAAIAFVLVFSYIRINEEDGLMAERFGKQYERYKQHVKAFIPYLL